MHIVALQFLCKAGWGIIYLYLFVAIYMDQTNKNGKVQLF